MSLGSWRTYERIPREQGVAVMRAAREAGINFLDDARYDDARRNAYRESDIDTVRKIRQFAAAGQLG